MELNLAQIRDISMGAVRVTQEQDGFHFYRFTQAQEALYRERSEDFYSKTFSTSGIQLQFKTNSENLGFKTVVAPGSSRKYFAFDLFVNGKKQDSLDNFRDVTLLQAYTTVELPQGEFAKEFALGAGEKEVRIVFPWSVRAVLQELSLDDGSYVEPVKAQYKLLCFGDSITHGYDALYPSNKYVSQLAEFLHAEEYNKAIGGEIFFPELAAEKESFDPDYVIVAYGTNDWSKCGEEEFRVNCSAFYANLSRSYPAANIFVLTPIWRKDYTEYRKFGAFESVEQIIRASVAEHANISVITGFDVVPQREELYADLRLHPNDEGFAYYYENVKMRIAEILQREK